MLSLLQRGVPEEAAVDERHAPVSDLGAHQAATPAARTSAGRERRERDAPSSAALLPALEQVEGLKRSSPSRSLGASDSLHPEVKVHGRIVSRAGGRPKQALLTFRQTLVPIRSAKQLRVRTDDRGRYSLVLPAPAAYGVEISARDGEEPVQLASGLTLQVTGLRAAIRRDFSVSGTGRLVVRTLLPAGGPAPSIPIRVARREVFGWTRFGGVTNGKGLWQAPVAAGEYVVRAFSAERGLIGSGRLRVAEDDTAVVELPLSPTLAWLRGRVVDAESRLAIDRARVQLLPQGQRHALPGEFLPSFETDSRGAFALPVEKPGEHTLRVRASGYLESAVAVPIADVADSPAGRIEVEMTAGHAVIGEVIDWIGQPVAGAEVHLRTSREGAVEQVTALSDESGAFHFDGLPLGDAQIWASHSESISEKSRIEVPAAGVLLELRRSGTVEGVVEWAHGRPVEDPFSLLLIRDGPPSLDSLIPFPGRIQNRSGVFVLRSVEPGRYRIQVNVLRSQGDRSQVMTGRSDVFEVTPTGPAQVVVRVTAPRPIVEPDGGR